MLRNDILITEELFESRMRPEEERFHSILLSMLKINEDDLFKAMNFDSIEEQTFIMQNFTKVTFFFNDNIFV